MTFNEAMERIQARLISILQTKEIDMSKGFVNSGIRKLIIERSLKVTNPLLDIYPTEPNQITVIRYADDVTPQTMTTIILEIFGDSFRPIFDLSEVDHSSISWFGSNGEGRQWLCRGDFLDISHRRLRVIPAALIPIAEADDGEKEDTALLDAHTLVAGRSPADALRDLASMALQSPVGTSFDVSTGVPGNPSARMYASVSIEEA